MLNTSSTSRFTHVISIYRLTYDIVDHFLSNCLSFSCSITDPRTILRYPPPLSLCSRHQRCCIRIFLCSFILLFFGHCFGSQPPCVLSPRHLSVICVNSVAVFICCCVRPYVTFPHLIGCMYLRNTSEDKLICNKCQLILYIPRLGLCPSFVQITFVILYRNHSPFQFPMHNTGTYYTCLSLYTYVRIYLPSILQRDSIT